MAEPWIHIYAPAPIMRKAQKVVCLDCKKESLHLVFGFEWFGPERTCLRCGRHWSDGEWMSLGFYRNARKDNKESAKRQWRRMEGQTNDGRQI